ncbi:hypothetical protein BV25DRAFT_1826753, partial [Artomyces pyxidatus]
MIVQACATIASVWSYKGVKLALLQGRSSPGGVLRIAISGTAQSVLVPQAMTRTHRAYEDVCDIGIHQGRQTSFQKPYSRKTSQ